jgi:hypothetical protein
VQEKVVAAAVPGEWAVRKLIGPLFDEVGTDLARAYAAGRDKLLSKATSKVEDLEDGRRANLRVAKDVLMNGSITDDEVCAEYFGGVLASSRSEDGADDGAIGYVGAIQGMSSKQLRLHYFIYNELNRLLSESSEKVHVGQGSELNKWGVYILTGELMLSGMDVTREMVALSRLGLVSNWTVNSHPFDEGKLIPYLMATPTTFGVLLYAVAHNRLSSWTQFSSEYFGVFDGIKPLGMAERTLEALVEMVKGQLKAQGKGPAKQD